MVSGFVKDSTNFNSFLFGSIVSVSHGEMIAVCVISGAVLLTLGIFSRELFYIGFDENAARVSGVPVRQINFMFTILTALTVSVASRTVGTFNRIFYAGSSGGLWDANGEKLSLDIMYGRL